MDIKECKRMFTTIQMNYRNFYKDMTVEEMNVQINTYMRHFKNQPIELMIKALDNYMSLNESYPPSIAHFNKELFNIINPETITAEESFEKIVKLIFASSFNLKKIDKAELNKIEEEIVDERYIRNFGLSEESDRPIFRSQYIKIYKAKAERKINEIRKNLNQLTTKEIQNVLTYKKVKMQLEDK